MTTISSTASTGVTTPTTYVNPVASSTTLAGLSKTAAQLGQDSSVIATLGGTTSTTPLYNAVGLLNSIIQAGAAQSNSSATSSTGGSTTGTSGTSDTGDTGASTGTSTGASTTGTSNINTDWATALKANPALASSMEADTTAQAVLSTLSTTA